MHKNRIGYDKSYSIMNLFKLFVPQKKSLLLLCCQKLSKQNLQVANFGATIAAPQHMPQLVTINKDKICSVVIDNCAPNDITIKRNSIFSVIETELDTTWQQNDWFPDFKIGQQTQKLSFTEEWHWSKSTPQHSRTIKMQICLSSSQIPRHNQHWQTWFRSSQRF